MARVPTLIGIGDPFKGEVYHLDQFRVYIVGRSRSADISVKRTAHYKAQSEHEREQDADTKTISAKHFQITFYNLQSIEILNLGANGTLLDGKRLESAAVIKNIASRPYEIKFGSTGRFKLTLSEREEDGGDPLPLE